MQVARGKTSFCASHGGGEEGGKKVGWNGHINHDEGIDFLDTAHSNC